MINWFLVAIIPFAIILGIEMNRRKQIAVGEIFCFQPIWSHRLLTLILTGAFTLFIETARVTLINATQYHIWMLILSTITALLSQTALSANEIHYAKKQIKEGLELTK